MDPQIPLSETLFSSDEDMTQAMADLYTSSKWMKFMAIVGFVFVGILASLACLVLLAPNGGVLISVMLIIFGTVILLPILFVFNYSRGIQKFQQTGNHEALEAGFENQRRFWVFYGILLSVYLVAFVILLAVYGTNFAQILKQLR